MAKKITLSTPHVRGDTATEYTLVKIVVQYETGTTVVMLEDQLKRSFSVKISSIPATTQEQAILALINNGMLAGAIRNA